MCEVPRSGRVRMYMRDPGRSSFAQCRPSTPRLQWRSAQMAQAQRTAHAVPSHVLELFWALASVESGKREVRYFVRSQQHLGLALCGAAAPPRLYYVV